jgi:glycerol-3-phosphate dehydrogenase
MTDANINKEQVITIVGAGAFGTALAQVAGNEY